MPVQVPGHPPFYGKTLVTSVFFLLFLSRRGINFRILSSWGLTSVSRRALRGRFCTSDASIGLSSRSGGADRPTKQVSRPGHPLLGGGCLSRLGIVAASYLCTTDTSGPYLFRFPAGDEDHKKRVLFSAADLVGTLLLLHARMIY